MNRPAARPTPDCGTALPVAARAAQEPAPRRAVRQVSAAHPAPVLPQRPWHGRGRSILSGPRCATRRARRSRRLAGAVRRPFAVVLCPAVAIGGSVCACADSTGVVSRASSARETTAAGVEAGDCIVRGDVVIVGPRRRGPSPLQTMRTTPRVQHFSTPTRLRLRAEPARCCCTERLAQPWLAGSLRGIQRPQPVPPKRRALATTPHRRRRSPQPLAAPPDARTPPFVAPS